MPIIKSISGLRATLDELTKTLLNQNIIAFHRLMPNGKIIIGRDGRASGEWIEKSLAELLKKLGRNVDVIGIAPTPTIQLYVQNSDAIGGIAITASHNPATWNGLKLMNSDGTFLDAAQNETLNEIFSEVVIDLQKNKNKIPSVPKFEHGNICYKDDAIESHIENALNLPLFKEILPAIKSRNFKIVVDAVNASGSKILPKCLAALNCEVVKLHCDMSGNFPHNPEPLTENLTELAESVKENKADLGVAVDPDADRLVLIDETGVAIGEEKTICVAMQSLLEIKSPGGNKKPKVVVNQSTTHLADFVAAKYNAELVRSAVGEINVVRKMQEIGAVIGGEGSGGVILPDSHYGRDSLIGIVLVLALLAKKNAKLSDINAVFPVYKMRKEKRVFEDDFDELSKKIEKKFAKYEISKIDGLKIYFENSWVHLRKSNTEPIIRIIVENMEKGEE